MNTEPIDTLFLEAALLVLDDCRLDCDGMTYAASYILSRLQIPHTRMEGTAYDPLFESVITPHCWIELSTGHVVDFRLRRWIGDSDLVPHGIFSAEAMGITYAGRQQETPPPTLETLRQMTDDRIMKVLPR